ncbi:MAG: hypothetical protein HC859_12000 [Bacteroidia bacterium]|nr:hypothetical protein [Bacteroidia bacterium]
MKFVLYGVCVLLGFTAQAQQEYTMEWLDPVGATISDSSITVTKNVANGWNNSGAVGRYYLQGGQDGWIEYTVNSTTERKAVGFADYNQNNTYYTTDYALYLGGDAKFYAAMNGALMADVPVSVGDVLRLERVGDEMKFMKNGTPIHVADSVITSLLIPDIAIYTNGAVFTDVTASFGRQTNPIIEWADITGLSIAGNNLTRSRAGAGYTSAGAFSTSVLPAGQDGWVEMTAQNLNYTRILGLSSANTSNDFGVEFGMQFGGSANINILENGTSVAYLGKYVVGTVGRVSREGTQLKYYIDGVLKYTSTNTSGDSLYVDAGMYNLVGTIGNIQLSFSNIGAVPDHTEFLALKALYDSLDGDNWTTKTGWPTSGNWPASAGSAEFSSWYGVTVVDGDVTGINLGSNNLAGDIPAALGDLTGLETFDVQYNQITGPLPSSIQNLTLLSTLAARNNQVTGSIPSGIGNLLSLKTLDFTSNELTGSIPASLGNLDSLELLYLHDNNLTGSIPSEIGGLTRLKYLILSSNQLSGSIPTDIGNLTELIMISLDYNQLSGRYHRPSETLSTFKFLLQLSTS